MILKDHCPQHEAHDDLCVGCLTAKLAFIEQEKALLERPHLAKQQLFQKHGVFMRHDVAPAVMQFVTGLLENGLEFHAAMNLASVQLQYLMNMENPPC